MALKTKLYRKHTVIGIALLLSILMVVYLLPPHYDWRAIGIEARCIERMNGIDKALREYVLQNDDFPKDSHGSFNPDLLLCDEIPATSLCMNRAESFCALERQDADKPWSGFVWCKTPTRAQVVEYLHPSASSAPNQISESVWVVLCHQAQHAHKVNGKQTMLLLLSNGQVWKYQQKKKEYDEWFTKEFCAGDNKLPMFLRTYFNYGAH